MDYKNQYAHPKWQEKRLEAFNAIKDFHGKLICSVCGDDETQLHVHHKRYIKNRMIWEYDISELEVLCGFCHKTIHEEKDRIQNIISRIDSNGISEIAGLLCGYCTDITGPANTIIDDVLDEQSDHWTYRIGRIAALISNRTNIGTLDKIINALEDAEKEETLNISIPKRTVEFGYGQD